MKSIPFSAPDIQEADLELVLSVIRSGWLTHGEYSTKLESLFCEITGAKYSATVANCTAGLHLSCMAAGIGSGDEVIVPAQTHTATAHAVEHAGAKAIFCDASPLTGNIKIDEIEANISTSTKALIPVHMAGLACEMDDINDICEKYDLILIEDCAHALGTTFNGKHVGKFGLSGCFSFYPTKQITTGEGGMVISDHQEVIEKVRRYKAFGINTPPELRTKPGIYDVQDLGYNYRMTDFQAALGVGQLERYPANLHQRRKNARTYAELLKGEDAISYPVYSDQHSYFLFQIILDQRIDRDRVLLGMKDHGIGVSIHYATPVPMMSYYKNKYSLSPISYPNAVDYGRQSISLPVHQMLSEQDIEYVCNVLTQLVGGSQL